MTCMLCFMFSNFVIVMFWSDLLKRRYVLMWRSTLGFEVQQACWDSPEPESRILRHSRKFFWSFFMHMTRWSSTKHAWFVPSLKQRKNPSLHWTWSPPLCLNLSELVCTLCSPIQVPEIEMFFHYACHYKYSNSVKKKFLSICSDWLTVLFCWQET